MANPAYKRRMEKKVERLADVYVPGSSVELLEDGTGFTITLPDAHYKKDLMAHLEKIGFNQTNRQGIQIGSAASEPRSKVITLTVDNGVAGFRYLEMRVLPEAVNEALGKVKAREARKGAAASHVDAVLSTRGEGQGRG